MESRAGEQVEKALTEAKALTVLLSRRRPASAELDIRQRLAMAHLVLCLEHREGIQTLIEQGRIPSGLALLRPMMEALYRGIWTAQCATTDQAREAWKTGRLPKFDTITKGLSKQHASYSHLKARIWDTYSDFAHGHMRQMARLMGALAIEFQHDENEVIELLAFSDIHAVHAVSAMVAMTRGSNELLDELEDMAKRVSERHKVRNLAAANRKARSVFEDAEPE